MISKYQQDRAQKCKSNKLIHPERPNHKPCQKQDTREPLVLQTGGPATNHILTHAF